MKRVLSKNSDDKTITCVVYLKKTKQFLRRYYHYIASFGRGFLTSEEVKDYIRDGYTVTLDQSRLKDTERNIREFDYYLDLIHATRNFESRDTKFLNKIIREGGFVSYIKKLEGRV